MLTSFRTKMNVSDLLVDLTAPIQNSRRKSDNVVDLTEEDEDIQFIQPPSNYSINTIHTSYKVL